MASQHRLWFLLLGMMGTELKQKGVKSQYSGERMELSQGLKPRRDTISFSFSRGAVGRGTPEKSVELMDHTLSEGENVFVCLEIRECV